jgi:hypothetical protein
MEAEKTQQLQPLEPCQLPMSLAIPGESSQLPMSLAIAAWGPVEWTNFTSEGQTTTWFAALHLSKLRLNCDLVVLQRILHCS